MQFSPERIDMLEMLRHRKGSLLYDGAEGAIVLSSDGTLLLSDIQDGAFLCGRNRHAGVFPALQHTLHAVGL